MENKKINKFITKIEKENNTIKNTYLSQGAEYVYENANKISQMRQIVWYLTDHFYDRFENDKDFTDSGFDKLQNIDDLCKKIYTYYENINNFEGKYNLDNYEDLDLVIEYFKEDHTQTKILNKNLGTFYYDKSCDEEDYILFDSDKKFITHFLHLERIKELKQLESIGDIVDLLGLENCTWGQSKKDLVDELNETYNHDGNEDYNITEDYEYINRVGTTYFVVDFE